MIDDDDDVHHSGAIKPIVRGTRDGLVIRLPDSPSPLDLIQDLQDDIERARRFFQRGELTIDYGTRNPNLEEIRALEVVLQQREIRLRTVTADGAEFRELLESWGFEQPRQRRSRQLGELESR
jgi:septum site-determining protein MinC